MGIQVEIQRLAKQKHNLERIYAQGYIEDTQYIERKNLIEQQLDEKRIQLSRTSISKNVEQTLKSTRQIEKILDSGPPLTYFDEHTFTEMVKKVSVSNTAIEFELINGMKLSEERTENEKAIPAIWLPNHSRKNNYSSRRSRSCAIYF